MIPSRGTTSKYQRVGKWRQGDDRGITCLFLLLWTDTHPHKLIARQHNIKEIQEIIGADSLHYLSHKAVRAIAAPIPPEDLCIACFSGQYPSDIPDDALRDRYAKRLIRGGELQ